MAQSSPPEPAAPDVCDSALPTLPLVARAREAHASTYLTLMSIVQSVTFGFLAFFVGRHAPDFSIVEWLLAVVTFCTIVVTWNEYVMGTICFRWVPDVLDAFIPFILAALEVMAIHRISDNPGPWFLAMGLFSLGALVAFTNMYVKAKREGQVNAAPLSALGKHAIGGPIYAIVCAGTTFSCWIVSCFVTSTSLSILIAFVAVFLMSGFLVRTWLYWRTFIAFARRNQRHINNGAG